MADIMTSSETASYVHNMVSQITYVHRVDLLEKVFHQCGLCGELMLHDKYDSLYGAFVPHLFGKHWKTPVIGGGDIYYVWFLSSIA